MNASKKVLGTFAVFGVFAGLAYWLYLYVSDPTNAPSPGDVFDYFKSYLSRGYLIMKGQFQNVPGVTADPMSLAAALIAEEESFSPKAYPDPQGQTLTYSIGYGHQIVSGDGFTTASVISEADALALLYTDLQRYADAVNAALTVTLSPQQLAALYDFEYNEGIGAFQRSTLLQDINAGADSGIVANDLRMWTRAGGETSSALTARRNKEANLYASGTPATNQGAEFVAQYGPDAGVDPSTVDDTGV